jgi:hypothetical protein
MEALADAAFAAGNAPLENRARAALAGLPLPIRRWARAAELATLAAMPRPSRCCAPIC